MGLSEHKRKKETKWNCCYSCLPAVSVWGVLSSRLVVHLNKQTFSFFHFIFLFCHTLHYLTPTLWSFAQTVRHQGLVMLMNSLSLSLSASPLPPLPPSLSLFYFLHICVCVRLKLAAAFQLLMRASCSGLKRSAVMCDSESSVKCVFSPLLSSLPPR